MREGNGLQRAGGAAALVLVAAYLIGMVLNFTLLDTSGSSGPVEQVAFLVDHQTLLYIETLLIYVVFGAFLVVFSLALFERLRANARGLASVATVFGLVWAGLVMASGMVFNVGMGSVVDLYRTDPAQAATVWQTINAVFLGLGGGNEIPGGLWTLLASLAALQAEGVPKVLSYLGILAGLAGLLTVVPPLFAAVVTVFALGQIVWWVGWGIILLRPGASPAGVMR